MWENIFLYSFEHICHQTVLIDLLQINHIGGQARREVGGAQISLGPQNGKQKSM